MTFLDDSFQLDKSKNSLWRKLLKVMVSQLYLTLNTNSEDPKHMSFKKDDWSGSTELLHYFFPAWHIKYFAKENEIMKR